MQHEAVASIAGTSNLVRGRVGRRASQAELTGGPDRGST